MLYKRCMEIKIHMEIARAYQRNSVARGTFFFGGPISFPKKCWRVGEGGWKGKIFSGHLKKGRKKFSGLTSVKSRFQKIFREKFFLNHW
jgi:hypothetical protein